MKYLPDMNAGKKILAIAMTEPVAGSDLQGVRTTATKSDDGKVSNEAAFFITRLRHDTLAIGVLSPPCENHWLANLPTGLCAQRLQNVHHQRIPVGRRRRGGQDRA